MEILHVPQELLERNIAYATQTLRHSWGLSTTLEQRGNVIPREDSPQQVRMRVSYDSGTERYIRDRMMRGKRVGHTEIDRDSLEFTVQVTDTSELRP